MSEVLCPALSIRRVLSQPFLISRVSLGFSSMAFRKLERAGDDHLSRRPIARELKRRGVRSDGTIGNPACPNPPCVTMSLPSSSFRERAGPRFPRRFTPIWSSRPFYLQSDLILLIKTSRFLDTEEAGRRTGFVSVALVLMPLYRICATWMGVTHRAFQ